MPYLVFVSDAPQPIVFLYKFIVSNRDINQQYQYFEIIRRFKNQTLSNKDYPQSGQLQIMQTYNKDTIKLYVSLINQLKNNQNINVNNKLLNIQIGSLRSDQLKLLLETQSCNNSTDNIQHLQVIEAKAQTLLRGSLQDIEETFINRKLILKIKGLRLSNQIKNKNSDNAINVANKLISFIKNGQQMKFILKIMFNIESLICIQRLDSAKLNKQLIKNTQIQKFYYLMALIKMVNRLSEAKDIFKNNLNNKYTFQAIAQQQKILISVLKLLIEKEKGFLNKNYSKLVQQEGGKMLHHDSTKKILKNKFFLQHKIDLDQAKGQVQKVLNKLDERVYLIVSPLFHLYNETNYSILQKLSETQLNRKIATAKSIIVETLPLDSANKSKIKTRSKYQPNPLFYQGYLKDNAYKCENIYVGSSTKGDYFIKHNYNNLYSTIKYVKFTPQKLRWGKQKKDIDTDSTKININEIVGIIYGKISARHQQTAQTAGQSFSFVMKDRTLDLSTHMQKNKHSIYDFVLGASWIIDQYHAQKKCKFQRLLQAKSLKNQQSPNAQILFFHEMKKGNLTKGKLLWKDLFASFATKTYKHSTDLLPKAKNIITVSKNAQSDGKLNKSQNKSMIK